MGKLCNLACWTGPMKSTCSALQLLFFIKAVFLHWSKMTFKYTIAALFNKETGISSCWQFSSFRHNTYVMFIMRVHIPEVLHSCWVTPQKTPSIFVITFAAHLCWKPVKIKMEVKTLRLQNTSINIDTIRFLSNGPKCHIKPFSIISGFFCANIHKIKIDWFSLKWLELIQKRMGYVQTCHFHQFS